MFGRELAQRFGEFANKIATLSVSFKGRRGEILPFALVVLEGARRLKDAVLTFPKTEGNEETERGGAFVVGKVAQVVARFFRERRGDFFGRFSR